MTKLQNVEYYFKTTDGYVSKETDESGRYAIIPTRSDYPLEFLRRNVELLCVNSVAEVNLLRVSRFLPLGYTVIEVATEVEVKVTESTFMDVYNRRIQ